jgi:hypothetical protein
MPPRSPRTLAPRSKVATLAALASLGAWLGASGLSGCATYQDELSTGQSAFEASEHERALAIFRALEPDTSHLSSPERAHYAYLRGMTDFRIGYKAEARHWLSIAAAINQAQPGSLPEDWAKRLADSLKELNEEVYTAGIEALSNASAEKAKANDEPPPAPAEDTPAPSKKQN